MSKLEILIAVESVVYCALKNLKLGVQLLLTCGRL
jgi:hypothetical protein